MITELYIRDFALISQLHIQLRKGFSVITGETGAGKSIILGAIGLLLGDRADLKSLKQGSQKCVIEAHFRLDGYRLEPFFEENGIDYDPEDCIIRRELLASGKSRAFINDTPVSLSLLRELGAKLVDVHSQHQNLLLGKQDFQLEVVDIIAANQSLLHSYASAYLALQNARRRLSDLEEQIAQNRERIDFMQFQFNELSSAQLLADDQEELEQTVQRMEHSEDIKTALYSVQGALSAEKTGVVEQLRSAEQSLRSVSRLMPEAEPMAERLASAYIDLKDMASDISAQMDGVDFDPVELDRLNGRLDLIYTLEKKYRVKTVAELLALQEQLHKQLQQMENSDEALADLRKVVEEEEVRCASAAAKLTERRQAAAKDIERQMEESLLLLGMPSVRFSIRISPKSLGPDGADQVEMLFSANKSTPMQPVASVASGGEVARVMLSLKAMISGAVSLPTIIFDEIDTGVSGRIAEQMGAIMQAMGREGRQVISITHLPQIAALGSSHYCVYKEETLEGTESHVIELTPEDRVLEIAKMLSGAELTDAAIENARALLKHSEQP